MKELLAVVGQDTRRSLLQRARIDYRSLPMSYLILRYSVELLEKRKWLIECLAGSAAGVLYPSGDVAMCEFTAPIGNLHDHDYDFARVWNSPRAQDLRKQIKGCSCIHGCWVYPSLTYSPANLARFARALLSGEPATHRAGSQ